jgi:hypothetical protein
VPFSPDFREGGSEQIREGAQKSDKTSQNSEIVEEILAGLRSKQAEKLAELRLRGDCHYNRLKATHRKASLFIAYSPGFTTG